MAGVFSVLAVGGIAVVAFVIFKVIKRRAQARDEEDDIYFEKYNAQDPPFNSTLSASHGPSDSSYNVATTAATADAYPDRTTHYGAAGIGAYKASQPYAADYPPGTAYAAVAQSGEQYQYSGQTGAYDNAYAQGGEQYQYTNHHGAYTPGPGQSNQQYQYANEMADAYTATAGAAHR